MPRHPQPPCLPAKEQSISQRRRQIQHLHTLLNQGKLSPADFNLCLTFAQSDEEPERDDLLAWLVGLTPRVPRPSRSVNATTHDRRSQPLKCARPAAALQASVNRQKALRLRLKGHSFRRIGEELGVTASTAHGYVHAAWERINQRTDKLRRKLRGQELAQIHARLQALRAILQQDHLRILDPAQGLAGPCEISVRNGGAIFDTNGFNVTVASSLAHSTTSGDNATNGGLTKNGAGVLTLCGVTTYTGNTTVNAGWRVV